MKKKLFTVDYTVTDYDQATALIMEKALAHKSFGVSALAVHGLIESVMDKNFQKDLENIDLIVPDGQPIKWALNSFYHVGLKEKVAGPILTGHVLCKANENNLRVYLFGSKSSTLEKIKAFLAKVYPNIIVSGTHPDRFREATPEEDALDINKINGSGASLVLVGRGCPRQDKWVAKHIGKVNAPMMAVGAAFDFMAGNIKYAPRWMQNAGLEWFYRLLQDPKRLWKRYLVTNTYFIYLFLMCKLGFRKVQIDHH